MTECLAFYLTSPFLEKMRPDSHDHYSPIKKVSLNDLPSLFSRPLNPFSSPNLSDGLLLKSRHTVYWPPHLVGYAPCKSAADLLAASDHFFFSFVRPVLGHSRQHLFPPSPDDFSVAISITPVPNVPLIPRSRAVAFSPRQRSSFLPDLKRSTRLLPRRFAPSPARFEQVGFLRLPLREVGLILRFQSLFVFLV